jgi:ketosteroid isomerase-like protein
MKTNCLLLLLATLFSMQAMAQTTKPVDSAILAANKVFMQAFASGAANMGDLYAIDAQLFPPNGAVITGNTAIGPVWKGAFDSGVKKATLETTETETAGDRIIETGRYTLAGADGKALDTGKYMVVWKKEGGTWKLYRDIWNTSMAAAK